MYTLGPSGTDAEAVALTRYHDIRLVESFRVAMELAWRHGGRALICAGYLRRDPETTHVVDSWVQMHFEWLQRMDLVEVWKHPTKEMGLAVGQGHEEVRSVAVHPSTLPLLPDEWQDAELHFVDAKPQAVLEVVHQEADACLGSVDIIEAFAELEVVETFAPQMIWCEYARHRRRT